MKKIFNIIFTFAALLAFAPIAGAQSYGTYSIKGQIQDTYYAEGNPKRIIDFPKDNGVQGNTDFAYSKDISKPFSDGTYWIKLESYSTGAASRIESAAPADIVLVLDYSNSMSQSYDKYIATGARAIANYSTQGVTGNNVRLYKHTDGEYYRLSATTSGNYRSLYFTAKDGVTYYLNNRTGQNTYDTSIQPFDHQPTAADGVYNTNTNNQAVWRGVLYNGSNSKLVNLQKAVVDFVKEIQRNNDELDIQEGQIGNRIALILYDHANYTRNGLNALIDVDAFSFNESNPTELLYSGSNVLAFDNGHGTNTREAMGAAYDILLPLKDDDLRTRTVVMFTDGKPTHYDLPAEDFPTEPDASAFSNVIASGCILHAYNIKNEIGAPVYAVGLFATADKTNQIKTYMEYTSSDFTDQQAMPTGADDYLSFNQTYGDYCFIVSDDMPLDEIFSEIAHQSGGSNTSLSAASANVDVVSNSFVLPADVTASTVAQKVKIFIARVDSAATRANSGKLVFEEEIIKGHLPDDWTYRELDEYGEIKPGVAPKKADNGISIELVTINGNPGIKVKGFDYSSCFCGPIYKDGWNPEGQSDSENLAHVDHYQGYKIIIMIPIKANQDAVGGPNVDTNAPGSGIFITDGDETAFVGYNSPSVSLPYNFFIQKEGLQPGESAKFMLERAYIPTDASSTWKPSDLPESAWSYVSTVFVTQPMTASATNEPIVKVRGLPSTTRDLPEYEDLPESQQRDYVYRISEEKWTWSYHRDGAQYSDKSKVDNPFYFENDKKDGIDQKVRHAESKVTNIFNGSSTNNKKYDDSKTNTSSSGGNRY